MKKRKSTEDFLQLMHDGIDDTNLILDSNAKVITREDNGSIVAVLDKRLNVEPQMQTV